MDNLRINADRLWDMIMETAAFGTTPDGGIRRLTLSDEDRKVRDWLCEKAAALGCDVKVDEVGNIFAQLPGTDPDALPVAIGSHLDTQPSGGKFDGILGVLAGLEIFQTLREEGVKTRRPLVLVNWTNEEGARFSPAMLGSGAYAGVFSREYTNARRDAAGIAFDEALDAIGYKGSLKLGDIRFSGMFELHIEQGPVLEREAMDIGIVKGVQAMRWYDVTLNGREAHAGSTPMDMRRDALADAAKLILAARDIALEFGGLATVGELKIASPSRNVIPGDVLLTLDLRHEADSTLSAMELAVKTFLDDHCEAKAHIECIWDSPAVHFDEQCVQAVRRGAEQTGAAVREIVSGAGHDAVNISRVAPTAMIFIPCKDGLSHNPAESATKEHCGLGTQTLLNAVLRSAA